MRKTVLGARRLTHAQGAGESGLSRLLELHAFNTAGDAAVAVALAGTLFFAGATSEARSDVAAFLLLTMLPFAIVAPLIGPFLDRFRRGRRWAIGTTMGLRAFSCWLLGDAIASGSDVALYPAALGVLVSSKAYGVTRSSAVPRLLPAELTLVKANSRISLTGTAGAMISAPIAAGAGLFGAEWTCRYAFVVFVIATVLAILLPEKVDSSEGEEQVDMAALGGDTRRARMQGIAPSVVGALRCNAALRFLQGFLLMYMAFVLREPTFDGWDSTAEVTIVLGLVLGALGAGQTLGTIVAAVVRSRAPERVVIVVLLADAVAIVAGTLLFSIPGAIAVALVAGLCVSTGKLSLDALIQRDIPESVRTSTFARSETLLQLSWVVGGFIGIVAPLRPPQVGLGIAAACVVGWAVLVMVLRVRARGQTPYAPASDATRPMPRPPSDPAPTGTTTSEPAPTDPEASGPEPRSGSTASMQPPAPPGPPAQTPTAPAAPSPAVPFDHETEVHDWSSPPSAHPDDVDTEPRDRPVEPDDPTVVSRPPAPRRAPGPRD